MKKILSVFLLIITFAITAVLSASAVDINEAFLKESFENEETVLPYRLYIPENFDRTKEYPLVLFLHGAGERGNDNEAQLKNMLQVLFDREDKLIHEAVVVVPQCPEGEQWVDTPWENGNYCVADVPESNELAAVAELIPLVAEKYSCDESRMYVMGISMGGFGTWDIMMRHPELFAAGIPVCGGADPEMAEIFMETPVFTFHGTADTSVPYEGTEEMVEAIEDLGSRTVNFVTYSGEEHGIWDRAAREEGLMEWLFSKVKFKEVVPTETAPIETEPTESSSDEIADTDAAIGTSEQSNNTDTEKTNTDKTDRNNDGDIHIGAIIAMVAAVVICVSGALAVALKKK